MYYDFYSDTTSTCQNNRLMAVFRNGANVRIELYKQKLFGIKTTARFKDHILLELTWSTKKNEKKNRSHNYAIQVSTRRDYNYSNYIKTNSKICI